MPAPRNRSPRHRGPDVKITVKYMAQLKRAAGIDGEEVELRAGCTVEVLVRRLAEREAVRGLLIDGDDKPQRALLVFVGDEQVDRRRTLHDNDHITLLTPMAGG